MKKSMIFYPMFFIICLSVHCQTWTNFGDKDWDWEFTVITQEQFNRIVKAEETIASFVSFDFYDASEIGRSKVIRGTRPSFNGYFYLSVKPIPKSENARINVSNIRAIVQYGNSKTGIMDMLFLSSWGPNTISLNFNLDEYRRKYNQLIRLVNGE